MEGTRPKPQEIQVLLQPLYEADKKRNLEDVNNTIVQLMCENKSLTFQQVEYSLREKKCWTYLIARKRNSTHRNNIQFELRGEKKTYFLFVSLQFPKIALEEIKLESKSYEENFQKLSDTGLQMLKNRDVGLVNSVNAGKVEITTDRLLSELSALGVSPLVIAQLIVIHTVTGTRFCVYK